MMTIQNDPISTAASGRPPTLRVRVLRELYDGRGMRIEDLAALAGMPVELVDAYERCSHLPQMILDLVRLAAALQVPLDELIASRRVSRIRESVVARRGQMEGGSQEIGFRCRDHDAR